MQIKTIVTVIQIGDNTHNQDQLITLQSFKTINISVSKPQKPIPPLELCLFFIIKFPPYL